MKWSVIALGCVFAWNVFAADSGGVARAAGGFLTAQSFPKTFEDASFADKMAVKAAGYEPWESEYDASGRCVRGCAFTGMTVEEEYRYLQRHTESALRDLREKGDLPTPTVTQPVTNQNAPMPSVAPTYSAPAGQVLPYDFFTSGAGADKSAAPSQPQVQPSDDAVQIAQHVSCRPNQPSIPAGQVVPRGEPLANSPRMTSPFGKRIHPRTKKESVHKGVDFSAPMGTNVFAPAVGRVAKVWSDETCGNGIMLTHSRRYETVYCHLSQSVVRVGDEVSAGCLIGYSGNSGASTGPHLHYAIKYNGEYINPTELIGR